MTRPRVLLGLILATGCADRLDFRHRADSGDQDSGGAAGAAGATQPLGAEVAYHLTLEETCDGPSPDAARFITTMRVDDTDFRTWGQRQEYMSDENVFTQGGACVIRAENRATAGAPYTSGTLNTAGHFEQLYGFFEARLQPPPGVGLWSVFWLRSIHGWPPAIDLLDYLDQAPELATASYWWPAATGSKGESYAWPSAQLHAGYHVFGCEWRRGYLAFFLDGQRVAEISPLTAEIDAPLYPSFNLSVPTAEDGRKPPDTTTDWPAELRIDWLRVYAAD